MIPSVVGSTACRSEARPTSLSARTGFGSADLFRMRPRASTNASCSLVRRCGWVALPYRGFPLSPAALRRASAAGRQRVYRHVKMFVCDGALTIFSLPNCMTSTRRFLQMAVWRSSALSPPWRAHRPDLPRYPGSAERDKRGYCTNACSGVVSRPCCTELPATVVTVWNVLGSCCVLLQHGLRRKPGAKSLI